MPAPAANKRVKVRCLAQSQHVRLLTTPQNKRISRNIGALPL